MRVHQLEHSQTTSREYVVHITSSENIVCVCACLYTSAFYCFKSFGDTHTHTHSFARSHCTAQCHFGDKRHICALTSGVCVCATRLCYRMTRCMTLQVLPSVYMPGRSVRHDGEDDATANVSSAPDIYSKVSPPQHCASSTRTLTHPSRASHPSHSGVEHRIVAVATELDGITRQ